MQVRQARERKGGAVRRVSLDFGARALPAPGRGKRVGKGQWEWSHHTFPGGCERASERVNGKTCFAWLAAWEGRHHRSSDVFLFHSDRAGCGISYAPTGLTARREPPHDPRWVGCGRSSTQTFFMCLGGFLTRRDARLAPGESSWGVKFLCCTIREEGGWYVTHTRQAVHNKNLWLGLPVLLP